MDVTVVEAIRQFNRNIEMDHDDYQDLMCKITWKFIRTHTHNNNTTVVYENSEMF